MKALKAILVIALVYVSLVAAFESLLGYFQPSGQSTLTISTTAPDGEVRDRVLARLDSDGQVFVAANHWPRAWYRHALQNPNVDVILDGVTAPYLAVPVTPEEDERVRSEHALGFVFRVLTGFPPRHLLRLEPR